MTVTDISRKPITPKVIRLGAYCRVSSNSADQLHSFAAQIRYYKDYERKNPQYRLVDVYADEGLTGTDMKKRDELNRLIRDCKLGNIDRIITKSVSRFARNTQELLVALRSLKEMGVIIYFEEQGIDSDKMNMEMLVTFPGMAAQQESVNISVPFPKKQTQKKLRKPNEAKEINQPAQSGKQNAREPATPKQSGDANDYKKPQCTQKCRPEPELGKQNAAGE